MNEMTAPVRLTSLAHGGGCGCKIAPGILSEILKTSPIRVTSPDLLVGLENNEDAAVYRINDRQALVATTDFFMPIVEGIAKSIRSGSPKGLPARRNCVLEPAPNRALCTLC